MKIPKIILILFLIHLSSIIYSQNNVSSFNRITTEDGLSNNSINQILQDRNGFIWIATADGLNKYDGYRFKIYHHNRNDSTSLSSSHVSCIFQDSKNRLWVGTNQGLNRYDKNKDAFVRCIEIDENTGLTNNANIESIIEDHSGNIWMGSYNSGLIRYNPKQKIFDYFYNYDEIKNQQHAQIIKPVVFDSKHLLVPIKKKGVFLFNLETNQFKKILSDYPLDQVTKIFKENDNCFYITSWYEGIFAYKKIGDEFRIIDNYDLQLENTYFTDIFIDAYQTQWATSVKGLYVKNKNGITVIKNNPIDPNSLVDNHTACVYADNNNGIWIGTTNHGISYFSYHSNKFKINNIGDLPIDELFNVPINDINKGCDGNYWVATEGNGIYQINPKHHRTENYRAENIGLAMNSITCVHLDSQTKGLWIGTKGGLSYWSRGQNKTKQYLEYGKPNGISSKFVQTIFEDNKSQIWLGLNGGGVNKYKRESETFRYFQNDVNDNMSISSNGITVIFVDREGNYWFGTQGAGLNLLNDKDSTFSRIGVLCSQNNIYSDVTINCIKQAMYPGFWIGTSSGLVYYNHKTGFKKSFSIKDGLPDHSINSIEIDKDGNLWIGTNNGFSNALVSRHSENSDEFIRDIQFVNYYKKDGLLCQTFLPNSSTNSSDGELLFGTLKGIVSVVPGTIKASAFQPNIVITRLQIGGKTVEINDTINNQVVLKENISEISELSLNYKNRNFSIDFASLDFTAPLYNEYIYMLDGFDKEWRKTNGTNRTATYTNLDHATYTLLIKGSNSDGVWSAETKKLTISIIPPWWLTWWAYLSYSVIILALFIFYFYISNSRINLKKTLEFEKKSREKEEELMLLKNRFFTNVTHEFRTPLSLILGPTDQLLDEIPEDATHYRKIKSIKTNATRLLNLINELLSIRKIQSGNEKLTIQEIDIVDFSQNIVQAFKENSQVRNIDFKIDFPSSPIMLFFDPFKIEKVLFNLLSNAFKYNDDNGLIAFTIKSNNDEPGYVEITVKDNGRGIKAEEQNKIFERFYVQNQRNTTSLGIGLSITKDYVEMHKGKIEIESTENIGTSIIVKLPLGKAHFNSNDLVENPHAYHLTIENHQQSSAEKELLTIVPKKRKELPHILIIEDNKELLNFIANELQNIYNVDLAVNGEEGIKCAKELIPDLIISDVIMPVKDGIEVCKEIKKDILTSHIPIILLTAKSFENDKIEAYQIGADAYISKPFSFKHLKVRIENLLEQRNKLREIYIQQIEKEGIALPKEGEHEIKIPLVEIEVKALDNQFMDELFAIINNNLTDPTLNVEKICSILGMNYNQLYRKVKALTNMSVKDLIMKTRLKAAANLLLGGKVNVSEAGYLTGFNSPAYFTKTFKDFFGLTPTCYIEKNRTKDTV